MGLLFRWEGRDRREHQGQQHERRNECKDGGRRERARETREHEWNAYRADAEERADERERRAALLSTNVGHERIRRAVHQPAAEADHHDANSQPEQRGREGDELEPGDDRDEREDEHPAIAAPVHDRTEYHRASENPEAQERQQRARLRLVDAEARDHRLERRTEARHHDAERCHTQRGSGDETRFAAGAASRSHGALIYSRIGRERTGTRS